jgi:hypothetical protein
MRRLTSTECGYELQKRESHPRPLFQRASSKFSREREQQDACARRREHWHEILADRCDTPIRAKSSKRFVECALPAQRGQGCTGLRGDYSYMPVPTYPFSAVIRPMFRISVFTFTG